MTAQTLRIALIAALFVAGQHGAALANGFGMPQGGELQRRLADFAATKPRSVIEFQPFRAQQQATTAQGATITLTSLQPKFNTWFTLDLGQPGRNTPYHLELANPQANTLQLLDDGGATLVFEGDMGASYCTPWQGPNSELAQARTSGLPYAPICDNMAFVRNEVRGNRSSREAIAEFLRDNIAFGESIVGLIKRGVIKNFFFSKITLV